MTVQKNISHKGKNITRMNCMK